MSSISSFPPWFQVGIEALQVGDISSYLSLYHQDAVHEFPFAPPGTIQRLAGIDAISDYMKQLPEYIRFGEFSGLQAHDAGNTLIVEATGHHHRLADGQPFDLSYIWVIHHHEGKVTLLRDYMNPLQLSSAFRS